MKISRNSKPVSSPVLSRSDTSQADAYAESKEHIQCAIDSLAKIAVNSNDPNSVTAASAIADLGVVMLGLK